MGVRTEDAVVPVFRQPSFTISATARRYSAQCGHGLCGLYQRMHQSAGRQRQYRDGSDGRQVLGMKHAQKSGVGTASLQLPGGVTVAALVGVNAFGDVIENGRVLAGAQKNGTHINTAKYMLEIGWKRRFFMKDAIPRSVSLRRMRS